MSKVNPENYVVIQGWMLSELELKGTELLVYAIIYGFSQAEQQCYAGSLGYLMDWTNTTKMTVMNALKNLMERGLVDKEEETKNGVKFCRYRANNYTGGIKIIPGSQKIIPGGGIEIIPGSQKIIPNNIEDNINTDNLINNIGDSIPAGMSTATASPKEVVDLYNQICVSYPKVKSLSETRKKAIKARLRSYTLDDMKTLFEKAEASSFLKGSNGRDWSATFDWLIKDSNIAKVLEGNYDDKKSSTNIYKQIIKHNEDLYNVGLREWVQQG